MKNIGLVGSGRWGKNLARNFYELGALHTICDVDKTVLETFSALYPGVQFLTDYKALLENSAISRVVIAAPAVQHYRLAKQALLSGKDVYVEKPLCLDCKEAEELIAIAEEKKRVLMVGHLLQYHPCIIALQELLQRGELGKLQYIVSNRLNLGPVRVEENALWNFAPHDVSVILSLSGNQMPQSVRSHGEAYVTKGVADTVLTAMKFDGSLKAHIYVSWLNPFKEQKLTVTGSSGMAVFDDAAGWEDKLVVYRNPLKRPRGETPVINSITKPERISVPYYEPLRAECEHFIESCNQRSSPKTSGEEGLRVLKVLQAAQRSLDVD